MRCSKCPMYHYWNNESDKGEACAIFGDGWDSPFQYEDKEGTTVGCYLDKHYIDKADAERDEYYASMASILLTMTILLNLFVEFERRTDGTR